jgi:hypothetical protein
VGGIPTPVGLASLIREASEHDKQRHQPDQEVSGTQGRYPLRRMRYVSPVSSHTSVLVVMEGPGGGDSRAGSKVDGQVLGQGGVE